MQDESSNYIGTYRAVCILFPFWIEESSKAIFVDFTSLGSVVWSQIPARNSMFLCSLWQASLNGKILKLPKLFEHAEHWSSQTIWNTLRRLQNYKQCVFFVLFCFVLSECVPNLWDLLPHHTTPKLSCLPLCILCCQTLNNKIVLGC